MILVAAFLVLVAVGLLVGGLAQGSATLQWASFAASALAAVLLAVSELRRHRAARADEPAVDEAPDEGPVEPPSTAADGAALPAVSAPPPAVEPAPALAPAVEPAPALAPAVEPVEPGGPSSGGAHAGADGRPAAGAPLLGSDGEPPVETVEVTDLLLVLDLTDEVLVVDEHPRYHLAGCPHLAGVETIPVPMDEARSDGFTPCGTCTPDRVLAERERARRSG